MIQFNRSNAGTLILLCASDRGDVADGGAHVRSRDRGTRASGGRAPRHPRRRSVVADDLLHRTVFEFEAFASRGLRFAISNHLLEHNTLPSAAELAADERASDVAFVIDRLFLIDIAHGTVTPPLPEPLQNWMLTKFPAIVRERTAKDEQQTYRFVLNGEEHLVVYGVAQLDQARIFAFTIHEKAIGTLAARAFARRSPFPGVLGGGTLTNADVFIRMTRGGRESSALPVRSRSRSASRCTRRRRRSARRSAGWTCNVPLRRAPFLGAHPRAAFRARRLPLGSC